MALVNLGWIFFRADSLTQARQMFSALLSPTSYARLALHPSLYLLVGVVAVGYAAVLVASDALDRNAERLEAETRSDVVAIALRNRRVWLAPIWAVACVLVLTLIPHQSRAANVFMYRFF